MNIDNKFNNEQIVYLKTDNEQLPRIVRSFQIYKTRIVYQLMSAGNESWHEEFEISTECNKPQINGFQK